MLTQRKVRIILKCIISRKKVVALAFAAVLLFVSMKTTHFLMLNLNIGTFVETNIGAGIEQYLDRVNRTEPPSCSVDGNRFGVVVNNTITNENLNKYEHLHTGFHKIKFPATFPAGNNSRRNSMLEFSESCKLQETDVCVFINGSKRGLEKVMNEVNFNGTKCSEKNPKFRNKNNPRTALASFPGSGNTWARHLLEYISGIHTGSIYSDGTLIREFKAEHVTDSRVIAIKTHMNYKPDNNKYPFAKAILLTRNPDETILAFYNYMRTHSHTRVLKQSMVNNTDWQRFVGARTGHWKNFHLSWLDNFKGKLMVLSYRRLKEDFFNEIFRLGVFLDVTMTYSTLWCAYERREGKYHRQSHLDKNAVFTKDMLASMATAQQEIEEKLYSMFGEEARATY